MVNLNFRKSTCALAALLTMLLMGGFSSLKAQTFVRHYGESTKNEFGLSIVESHDGNMYVTGFKEKKVLLSKMTSNGNVIWQRELRFAQTLSAGSDYILDLMEDPQDQALVGCGVTIDGSNRSGFYFKYDPDNDIMIWYRETKEKVDLQTIEITDDGNGYILSGAFRRSGQLSDGFLMRVYRSNGAVNWDKYLDMKDADGFHSAELYDGKIYATGRFTAVTSGSVAYGKMRGLVGSFEQSTGTKNWTKTYLQNHFITARTYTRDIVVDPTSGLTVAFWGDPSGAGTNNYVTSIANMDLSGNFNWSRKVDLTGYGHERVRELIKVDTCYYVLGTAENIGANNQAVYFMFKMNLGGQVQWCKTYDYFGAATAGQPAIAVNPANELVKIGNHLYFTGATRSFGSQFDIVLIKTDLDGTLDCGCISSMANLAYDTAGSSEILVSPTEQQPSVDTVSGPVPVDTVNYLATQACGDLILEESAAPVEALNTNDFGTRAFKVFPNPTSGRVELSWKANRQFREVQVVDMSGKLLQQETVRAGSTGLELELPDLPSGVYQIGVITANGRKLTQKLVIE